ncbi:hypothetical protein FB565_006149 [Actinoplanes lutulentus]|nr:hypothetical protein [Actinoplanes lutulentus]
MFGLHLLDEREARVEQDHRHHGNGECRGASGPGESGGDRQQDGKGLGELRQQLAGPAPAGAPDQFVGSMHDGAPGGFAAGQPLWRGAQVTQQHGDRFPGVHLYIGQVRVNGAPRHGR